MNIIDYIKDKGSLIILQVLGIAAASLFLSVFHLPFDTILLLVIGWFLVVFFYYCIDYSSRRRYFKSLLSCLERLDKKYLISDVLDKPQRLEDRIYRHILHMGNKAMMEEISSIRQERNEYKEYMEQWVHEMKTPLAAMKLICENNRTEETKKLLLELERANRYVEQVLYYARGENVEKDYLVREVNLLDAVKKSILNNKQLLRENDVQIILECEQLVYTDMKWIVFIMDQCIVNSVKYGAKQLVFKAVTEGDKTYFSITDDGIGILEEDLPRVFDKGFTGINGHEQEKSTGIGLYLCKKLCDKLEIDINIESQSGCYTKVILSFVTGRLNINNNKVCKEVVQADEVKNRKNI